MFHLLRAARVATRFTMPQVVAVLLVCLLACPAPAATTNWTGSWDTQWRDGGARVDLTQNGSQVTGSYPLYGGRIEAEAKGRTLQGTWIEGPRKGGFLFVMAPDDKSFMGRYDTGEWWTGGRVAASRLVIPVDQSGVRETLRTFVQAGNLAHAGQADQIAAAATVLDFGDRGANMASGEKVAEANSLFALVDLTTFHLWSIPGKRTPGDTYQLTLRQDGSTAALPLTFRRTADGKWWIVAPTGDELATEREALLKRFGGRVPAPDSYLRLRSPRDTMRAFLSAFADWEGGGRARALATLDTSELAPATLRYEGLLAAQYLELVLDRISQITPQEIPDDPTSRQPYVHFVHPAGQIVIAPEGEGNEMVWKFTPETVLAARALYAAVEDMPAASASLHESPPSAFFALRGWIRGFAPSLLSPVGPLELWQIVGAVLCILICLLLAMALARLIVRLVRWDVGRTTLSAERSVRWPLRLALTGMLFKLAVPLLGWPEEIRQFSAPIHAVVIGVFGAWAGWYLIDALSYNMVARAKRTSGSADDIAISLFLGALRLTMLCAAAIYVAAALSIPTAGLLAGLGISGLAIAFASKETLSNVFGASILVADRPFRKGDWIATGDLEGTVEQVGIRSTRIRTLQDTEIVVPNGKLADASINNWGSRRHRLLQAKLILGYGATPARIERFVAELRELIAGSPDIVAERTEVGISGLGESGIAVELTSYLSAATQTDEHARKNKLMLDILRLAERLGVAVGNSPVPAAALETKVPAAIPSAG